jgi:hypothetical protein
VAEEVHTFCDNGTNFRCAETEFQRRLLELDGDRLNREFSEIEQPGTAHFGSVVEVAKQNRCQKNGFVNT